MKSFTLEIDELAALVGFLNGKSIVGMDASLFASFQEKNVPALVEKLTAHGLMTPADRPGSHHVDEDLLAAVAVAVAPEIAVLARSKPLSGAILFYVAGESVTEIVVTNDRAVVGIATGASEMAEQIVVFSKNQFPLEIAVARVKGDAFDAGHVLVAGEGGALSTKSRGLLPPAAGAFGAASVEGFVRAAVADLVPGKRLP